MNSIIVSQASLSEGSPLHTYIATAGVSLYAKEKLRRKDIGKKLSQTLVQEGENISLHTVIARITTSNKQSIRPHEQEGFEHIGVMREVGQEFGRFLDVCLMQKIHPSKKAECL